MPWVPLPKRPSLYARQMKYLSDRIFGEPTKVLDPKTQQVVNLHAQKPDNLNERYRPDYHPPTPMFHELFNLLRLKGLYRDEHLDFNDEIERLRVKRGKGRPEIGEGKRALARRNK